MPRRNNVPRLPDLLKSKISKSGQTRGADDDEIYQNRVNRNGTVLIPYHFWNDYTKSLVAYGYFEHGYIVLLKPEEYFTLNNPIADLAEIGLTLGENCLVFYETRTAWNDHNPDRLGWTPANSRTTPLGGQYVARIPGTTANEDGGRITRGFTETRMKGAGIRLYEYATTETIKRCREQLEAEYWLCYNSVEAAVAFGMSTEDAVRCKEAALAKAAENGLLDYDRLRASRIINERNQTVCPLCLQPLSAYGFYTRMAQAEGREVPDLTVTEINLFHIEELRYGQYNHATYNLGWGHHHCNVVVKDAGIIPTLKWMKQVIIRNEELGTVIDIDCEE